MATATKKKTVRNILLDGQGEGALRCDHDELPTGAAVIAERIVYMSEDPTFKVVLTPEMLTEAMVQGGVSALTTDEEFARLETELREILRVPADWTPGQRPDRVNAARAQAVHQETELGHKGARAAADLEPGQTIRHDGRSARVLDTGTGGATIRYLDGAQEEDVLLPDETAMVLNVEVPIVPAGPAAKRPPKPKVAKVGEVRRLDGLPGGTLFATETPWQTTGDLIEHAYRFKGLTAGDPSMAIVENQASMKVHELVGSLRVRVIDHAEAARINADWFERMARVKAAQEAAVAASPITDPLTAVGAIFGGTVVAVEPASPAALVGPAPLTATPAADLVRMLAAAKARIDDLEARLAGALADATRAIAERDAALAAATQVEAPSDLLAWGAGLLTT